MTAACSPVQWSRESFWSCYSCGQIRSVLSWCIKICSTEGATIQQIKTRTGVCFTRLSSVVRVVKLESKRYVVFVALSLSEINGSYKHAYYCRKICSKGVLTPEVIQRDRNWRSVIITEMIMRCDSLELALNQVRNRLARDTEISKVDMT